MSQQPYGTYTGFGDPDDPLAFVPLHFDVTDAKFADWYVPQTIASTHIPGSARVNVQVMGNGLATVTWRVWVDSRDQYAMLMSYYGTQQTLVVLNNTQKLTGRQRSHFGVIHVELDDVLLMDVTNEEWDVTGYVACDVTFGRAVNLLTLGSDV